MDYGMEYIESTTGFSTDRLSHSDVSLTFTVYLTYLPCLTLAT